VTAFSRVDGRCSTRQAPFEGREVPPKKASCGIKAVQAVCSQMLILGFGLLAACTLILSLRATPHETTVVLVMYTILFFGLVVLAIFTKGGGTS
jgi:hypothetical protein